MHFSLSVFTLLASAPWQGTAYAQAAAPAGPSARPPAHPSAHELLVVGDSISAEYGLAHGSGWVALLTQRVAALAPPWTVVNASISGDTTSGGLARLPALLKQHPSVVVIELGGNDALRGLPMADTHRHLDAMVAQARAAGARVLVAGIMVPPNYGRQYSAEFAQMYVDVAAAHQAALVPFIFKGIADRPDAQDWFQADGIHPIAKAHPIILDNIWPTLQPLLKP